MNRSALELNRISDGSASAAETCRLDAQLTIAARTRRPRRPFYLRADLDE